MELLSRDLQTILSRARCCVQWLTEENTVKLPARYKHLREYAQNVLVDIDKVFDAEYRDDE